MTKVPVDVKGSLWWMAAFIWGWVTILSILSVHNQIDLFNLGFFAVLLIVGALLSIPAAQKYRRGGFSGPGPEPLSVQFVDTNDDKGEYSFRIVGQQRTKVGPRLKQPQIGQLGYMAWWTFVRAPLLVGDAILSALWGLAGNLNTEALPGVDALRGFGNNPESSGILEEAKARGLIDPDDQDIDNPYIGNF